MSVFAESAVVLTLDRSGFDNQMGAVKRDITSAMSGIGQIASGMLAATGISSAVGMVKTLGAEFISTNAKMEQYTISLGVMLKNQEQANQLIREVEVMAAKTPFSTDGLLKSVQLLKAYGFEANRLVPMLKSIGDAAAASPSGMEFGVQKISLALGQINAKGKLSAQEMNQLTEAGIPAWEALAKVMGITVAEAMAKTEKGAIDSKTAINALLQGMDERFGGMMEKQSHSWAGLVSTLSDFGSIVARKVGEPLFAIAKIRLNNLVDWADSPAAAAWIESVVPLIRQYAEGLAETGAKVIAFVTEHHEMLGTIAKTVALFGALQFSSTALTTAIGLISSAFSGLSAAGISLFASGGIFALGVAVVALLGSAFVKAAAEGMTFAEALGDILEKMQGLQGSTGALKSTEQAEKDFAERNNDDALRESRRLRGDELPEEKTAREQREKKTIKDDLDERNKAEEDEMVKNSKRAAPVGAAKRKMEEQDVASKKRIEELKKERAENARNMAKDEDDANTPAGFFDKDPGRPGRAAARLKQRQERQRAIKLDIAREERALAERQEEEKKADEEIGYRLHEDLEDKKKTDRAARRGVQSIPNAAAQVGNMVRRAVGMAGAAAVGGGGDDSGMSVKGMVVSAIEEAQKAADNALLRGMGLNDNDIEKIEKKGNRKRLLQAQMDAAERQGLDPEEVRKRLEDKKQKVQQFDPEGFVKHLQTALAPKDPLEEEARKAAVDMAGNIKKMIDEGIKILNLPPARAT